MVEFQTEPKPEARTPRSVFVGTYREPPGQGTLNGLCHVGQPEYGDVFYVRGDLADALYAALEAVLDSGKIAGDSGLVSQVYAAMAPMDTLP